MTAAYLASATALHCVPELFAPFLLLAAPILAAFPQVVSIK